MKKYPVQMKKKRLLKKKLQKKLKVYSPISGSLDEEGTYIVGLNEIVVFTFTEQATGESEVKTEGVQKDQERYQFPFTGGVSNTALYLVGGSLILAGLFIGKQRVQKIIENSDSVQADQLIIIMLLL